jgi:hypothetical protein
MTQKAAMKLLIDTGDFIVENIPDHKLCEGCGRIVHISAALCPACHSYRFDKNPKSIISRVHERCQLGLDSFGTLPRFV